MESLHCNFTFVLLIVLVLVQLVLYFVFLDSLNSIMLFSRLFKFSYFVLLLILLFFGVEDQIRFQK